MITLMHPCLIYIGSATKGLVIAFQHDNILASLDAEQCCVQPVEAGTDDKLVRFLIYDEFPLYKL